jgi:tRNA(Arg) A34 adenosine deaminase TadA
MPVSAWPPVCSETRMTAAPPSLPLHLPDWAEGLEDRARRFAGDIDKMRFVIDLARRNVDAGTDGPFGAAIFARTDGRLLAIGMNSVLRLKSSVLHAEMLAILRAEAHLGAHSLRLPGRDEYELFSSSEPCAMCLGGILWSGIRRLVCAAPASCARAIGFDEGPVTEASFEHLSASGIEIARGPCAGEAEAVIRCYRERGGPIYNP